MCPMRWKTQRQMPNAAESKTHAFCVQMQAAVQLAQEGLRPDVVVVDPPRKGCDPQVLEAIAKMSPQKLVYISCNSATLARDCKQLAQLGYRLKTAAPVDLFPRTTHVECAALLLREE